MDVTAAGIGWTTDAWCDGCGAPVEVSHVVIRSRAPGWLTPTIPPRLPAVHDVASCWCGPVTITVHGGRAWCVTCAVTVETPMRLAPDGFRLLHGPMPAGCDIVVDPDHGPAGGPDWLTGRTPWH